MLQGNLFDVSLYIYLNYSIFELSSTNRPGWYANLRAFLVPFLKCVCICVCICLCVYVKFNYAYQTLAPSHTGCPRRAWFVQPSKAHISFAHRCALCCARVGITSPAAAISFQQTKTCWPEPSWDTQQWVIKAGVRRHELRHEFSFQHFLPRRGPCWLLMPLDQFKLWTKERVVRFGNTRVVWSCHAFPFPIKVGGLGWLEFVWGFLTFFILQTLCPDFPLLLVDFVSSYLTQMLVIYVQNSRQIGEVAT